MNKFHWKLVGLIGMVLVAALYSLPNWYGEDPAVQLRSLGGDALDGPLKEKALEEKISHALKEAGLPVRLTVGEELLLRFKTSEEQLKAKDILNEILGEDYSIALNLAPATPPWLASLKAEPMKLGLDLRGGVHFLITVDVASIVGHRLESLSSELRQELRKEGLSYHSLEYKQGKLHISFSDAAKENLAVDFLRSQHPELMAIKPVEATSLEFAFTEKMLDQIRNETLEQTLTTLRKRVNELGVSEALVQRQGLNQVVVELPGIQDTARARDILGKTATLKFLMRDEKANIQLPAPVGSKLYHDRLKRPVILKNRIILSGEAVVGAGSGFDRDGHPTVNIRLGGNGIGLFKQTTRDNIGHQMAVIYVENHNNKTRETVISVATIQSALGNNFQISGLQLNEARDLALLLRSGAMPAALSIVEERIVGPNMGQDNIQKGMLSVKVGLGLVIFFMTVYYSLFGVLANIALAINLLLMIAIMSWVGATLTLPGIAGIVLTLGMAVDANVLIFERIREELRAGASPVLSIQRGFDGAFSSIIDSNLTTLIVGLLLFTIGSGPVKGFAVTLSIGILTSLFTAITVTRALVQVSYPQRMIKRLQIGI